MTPLRVAVIGAGPMGRLHARTVAQSAARDGDCRLTAIVDRHEARAAALAADFGVAALDDRRRLRDVDAAIVAVPTAAHVETATALVEAGLDVLVEKPLAPSRAAGLRLVERAEALGRILQVGHVEWYNPRWRDALARAGAPRRIEVRRLQPPSARGLDIDVVQDLMLHDLDWVIRAVAEEVDDFTATGRARPDRRAEAAAAGVGAGAGLVRGLDEAEVVLRFRGGCVARLVASRVHRDRRREVEIEGAAGTVKTDLLLAEAASESSASGSAAPGSGAPESAERGSAALDPLGVQWRRFVEATRKRLAPENDGRVGLAALGWVERVRERIAASGTGGGGGHDPLVRG